MELSSVVFLLPETRFFTSAPLSEPDGGDAEERRGRKEGRRGNAKKRDRKKSGLSKIARISVEMEPFDAREDS